MFSETQWRACAEWFMEASVLTYSFVWIEPMLEKNAPGWALSGGQIRSIGLSISFFGLGMVLHRKADYSRVLPRSKPPTSAGDSPGLPTVSGAQEPAAGE